tara:strand:+ start:497 stop:748 length:252 start_codon:yes stop_codon:yes gene_type:complete
MKSRPTTLLPPSPPFPFSQIDHIIMHLWDRHLELELSQSANESQILQHLDVTAAIIDWWEEKITEINEYEISKRRSSLNKNTG